jgi:hypothetical protein
MRTIDGDVVEWVAGSLYWETDKFRETVLSRTVYEVEEGVEEGRRGQGSNIGCLV